MNIDKALSQSPVSWVSSSSLSLTESLCLFSSLSGSLTEVPILYLLVYPFFQTLEPWAVTALSQALKIVLGGLILQTHVHNAVHRE